MEICNSINQVWEDLFTESRSVDYSLVSVKVKFTEVRRNIVIIRLYQKTRDLDFYVSIIQITQDQVGDFTKDISKFKESFINEGPSSVGTDLDAGNVRVM